MSNSSCNPKVIHLLNAPKAVGVTVFNCLQEEVGLTNQLATAEFKVDVGEMPAMKEVLDSLDPEVKWIAAIAIAADGFDRQAADVAVR
jgi:hypothetical protein